MECNKEEAVRAKEIAEKKMQDGDFSGAQKLARKAQLLFPGLDNVSHLLTVCEVHCSAQNKILGSVTDWYAVLQIERSADEMTIKQQYRKLALILHPDKNKFPDAEAAFKLIGEANSVLSDKTKRSMFDLKFRPTAGTCAPKPHPQQSQRNTSRKQGAANNVPKPPDMQFTGANWYQNADKTTFWTCCSSCNIRHQYQWTHVNKLLRCQGCQKPFTAYDLVSRGMPSPNQNGVPTPGPSKVPSQSNRGKSSAMAQEKVDGHGNVKEGVRMHKTYVANGKEGVRMHKTYVANEKEGVRMHKPCVANEKEGVGKPKPDGRKPSECRSPFPNQNGVPNPVFINGVPTPGPSKVPSQSNRGKSSAMAQEKVDGRGNVKEGARMHKTYVANGKEGARMHKPYVVINGKEGVGMHKPDGGKPSECRTSSNSDKKRK